MVSLPSKKNAPGSEDVRTHCSRLSSAWSSSPKVLAGRGGASWDEVVDAM